MLLCLLVSSLILVWIMVLSLHNALWVIRTLVHVLPIHLRIDHRGHHDRSGSSVIILPRAHFLRCLCGPPRSQRPSDTEVTWRCPVEKLFGSKIFHVEHTYSQQKLINTSKSKTTRPEISEKIKRQKSTRRGIEPQPAV